jgi:hypothetical protein
MHESFAEQPGVPVHSDSEAVFAALLQVPAAGGEHGFGEPDEKLQALVAVDPAALAQSVELVPAPAQAAEGWQPAPTKLHPTIPLHVDELSLFAVVSHAGAVQPVPVKEQYPAELQAFSSALFVEQAVVGALQPPVKVQAPVAEAPAAVAHAAEPLPLCAVQTADGGGEHPEPLNAQPAVLLHAVRFWSFIGLLQVPVAGALQPPVKVHAPLALAPAAVAHAEALAPAPLQVPEDGPLQPPLQVHPFVAPPPSAVLHADCPLTLWLEQTVEAGEVHPVPVKEQNALPWQRALSLVSPVHVVLSAGLTVQPLPVHEHPFCVPQLGSFPLHWPQVMPPGGLHPPENVHAPLALAPAAVAHAEALPAPPLHVVADGPLQPPLQIQALVAPVPSATLHADCPFGPALEHTLEDGAVQPVPVNEQKALPWQSPLSFVSLAHVVESAGFAVQPLPLHWHPF